MQVKFWGTRGSLPVAATASEARKKIIAALTAANGRQFASAAEIEAFTDSLPFAVSGSFGGNTACVEVIGESLQQPAEHVICDLGSGLRPLGRAKMAEFGPGKPQIYHVFVSHLHWDHLMGLPFFMPIYISGNRIVMHGCHPHLEASIRLQMAAPHFPVDFSQIGAEVEFDIMQPDQEYEIAGFKVRAKLQLHTGDSYAYRFEQNGKAVVYSTDSEHKLGQHAEQRAFIKFFQEADLVIFDTMYSLADAITVKADWGHSSNIIAVELCQEAQVARLAMFHHEPIHDDVKLAGLLDETRHFEKITRDGRPPLEIISSYDGLSVEL